MNKEIARIAAGLAGMAATVKAASKTRYTISGAPAACVNPEWLLQTSEFLVRQAEALLALIEDVEALR